MGRRDFDVLWQILTRDLHPSSRNWRESSPKLRAEVPSFNWTYSDVRVEVYK